MSKGILIRRGIGKCKQPLYDLLFLYYQVQSGPSQKVDRPNKTGWCKRSNEELAITVSKDQTNKK